MMRMKIKYINLVEANFLDFHGSINIDGCIFTIVSMWTFIFVYCFNFIYLLLFVCIYLFFRAEVLKAKYKKAEEKNPVHTPTSPISPISGISNLKINENTNENQQLVHKRAASPSPSPSVQVKGGGTYTKEEIAVLR